MTNKRHTRNDDTIAALVDDAQERLRRRKRLTQAHYEAVEESDAITTKERKRIMARHRALMIAAAKAGTKRMTEWDRAYLAAEAPELIIPEKVSAQEAKAKWRIRDRTIKRKVCADPERRAQLEAVPENWLKYYLPGDFDLDWGEPQREAVRAADHSMRHGASMTVAAPRGYGKSTILGGMALYGILAGVCSFPIVLGWTMTAAKGMLRGWLNQLETNTRIAEDYPEICQPFRTSIHAKRLRALLWPDGTSCGADVRIVERIIVLPGGTAMASSSVQASVRGLRVDIAGKGWIRPDVVLLDDPQDKKTAKSPELVRKVMDRIDKDLMSLSGPKRRLSLMAAVTVIERNDVAEKLLARRDSESVRCGQIVTWPAAFEEKDSVARQAWDQWNEERLTGLAEHDEGARAIAYYREHREAMTAGMTVSWPERYDEERGEPDAIYSAMWDFYRLGEAAFMAERQNQPLTPETTIYDLNSDLVAGSIYQGRERFEVPEDAHVVVAATDLNHYGLHSVAIAFGNDQTGSVAWYGRHDNGRRGIIPKNCNESEAKRLMFEALVHHGKTVASLPLARGGQLVKPDLWMIDTRYMGAVVRRYIEGPGRTCGVRVISFLGFDSNRYRPTPKNVIGKPREFCHMGHTEHSGRFIAANSDYWREVSQRAWLGTPGAPGSLSLHEGQHYEFAEQVTRVKLVEKLIGKYGAVWRYETAPGWHDWSDAVHMAYVAAVWCGIGTQGVAPAPRRKYVEQRKARVQIEDA